MHCSKTTAIRLSTLAALAVSAFGCIAEPADGDPSDDPTGADALTGMADREETGEAQQALTTSWSCYRGSDGRYIGQVDIWWGHTAGDATWACNSWISSCGNDSQHCRALGGSCDVRSRVDGCSMPLSDPASQFYKGVFESACNNHDLCYHGPWDAIGRNGFDQCNDNFWNDMGDACNARWWDVGCWIARSVWADAMNYYPLRGNFWEAYSNDQSWTRSYCGQ